MNLYIQESRYGIVLFADTNPFLVNNIASGILDCKVNSCDDQVYSDIMTHKNYGDTTHGMFFTKTPSLRKIDTMHLKDEPLIRHKIELVKLRAPAFRQLLRYYNEEVIPNLYGFGEFDIFIIDRMLKDKAAMTEYANLLKQDTDFLTSELSLRVESAMDDRFRLFTVCSMWASKINNCTTQDDIDRLMSPMKSSIKIIGTDINV